MGTRNVLTNVRSQDINAFKPEEGAQWFQRHTINFCGTPVGTHGATYEFAAGSYIDGVSPNAGSYLFISQIHMVASEVYDFNGTFRVTVPNGTSDYTNNAELLTCFSHGMTYNRHLENFVHRQNVGSNLVNNPSGAAVMAPTSTQIGFAHKLIITIENAGAALSGGTITFERDTGSGSFTEMCRATSWSDLQLLTGGDIEAYTPKATYYNMGFILDLAAFQDRRVDGSRSERLRIRAYGSLAGAAGIKPSIMWDVIKVGENHRTFHSSVEFVPPIKLDPDVSTDKIILRKRTQANRVYGALQKFCFHGWEVRKNK